MATSNDKPPSSGAFSKRQTIIIGLTTLIVLAVVLMRFAAIKPSADTASATTNTHLSGAAPFGTATPVPSAPQPSGSTLKAVSGANPAPGVVIDGYPDPRVDSANAKRLRGYAGNPDKVIMVSVTGQYMQAYEKGQLVRWSFVTTGRPGLDTPIGTFKIFLKQSPLTFIPLSTDPKSPEYGFPSKVQYGMEFADGGFYIHDVWWRTVYGPGNNYDHYDPGRREFSPGSHGCVNTPLEMVSWLWTWAPLGTTVIVTE